MANGYFHAPTNTGGSTPPGWTKPSDWPDISTVADNEIKFLVGDGTGIAFATTVASSGTYSIDWGDGTVETARASGTTYQHQYTYGSGTPTTVGSTYVIRIYGATGNITRWQVKAHSFTTNIQFQNYLWAVFGTTAITSYADTFYYITAPVVRCYNLVSCTIPSFASCTSCSQAFSNCTGLVNISMPGVFNSGTNTSMFYGCSSLRYVSDITSWGTVINVSSMFFGCRALEKQVLPTSWGNITTVQDMFSSNTAFTSVVLPTSWGSVTTVQGMFSSNAVLTSVTLPTSWGSVTTVQSMLLGCMTLTSVTLPTSWGSITTVQDMLSNCRALTSVTLPTSWGSVTTVQSMFSGNTAFTSVTLPSSWGSVTNINSLFNGCGSLQSVTLPNTAGGVTEANGTFKDDYSLREIVNLQYLGKTTSTGCTFSQGLYACEFITQNVTMDAFIRDFHMYGSSGKLLKVTSIRLTNASSTFGGISPQINVSYTSLGTTALELLFGDIPNGLSGQLITITGSTGAPALISKATSGTTSGSTTVTMANTSSLATGMEVYGTGLSTARTATCQDTGDTFTITAHGVPNDQPIMFTVRTTTTGFVINTTYYVVNATADTFQIATTVAGTPLSLTTNGSCSFIVIPKIVTINTNVSVILDIPASATGTVTVTAGTLKRSIALLKSWVVTG